ncbi:MAG TPA: aldo/keto reductase [Anaerolineae bacterium]|nr:aldo/keto reductase [Anaerolineae bacterium]HQI85986.1 aldo/keto reductase [Anaerolineae bacterium]
MDYINFGNTGLRVSRLSIGTGTHGWAKHSAQTALGIEGLANLLRRAYDMGVNFWDAADQYGSHPHVARALQGVPRERIVVATKTMARKGPDVVKDLARFRKELNTDVLDIVLLHTLSDADWPKKCADAMEALARAKETGIVRAVGFSCHGLGALRTAVETPWAEVVLVRINHAGVNMDAQPASVVPLIEKLHAAGKAVYGMKVLGCGALKGNVRAAIEYVLRLGTVHAFTIGMTSAAQLEENVRLVEGLAPKYPLRAE